MDTLHPELAARGSFGHLALGKMPRKNDPRTLKLATYLRLEDLPVIPASVDWAADWDALAGAPWQMYGNDSLGDCTCAAAGHMIQAWTANAGAAKSPTDEDVVALYWATGSGDTGRFELDVLNFWRTVGLGSELGAQPRDKILAFVSVNPSSDLDVRAGAFLFGGLYIGIALPLTAQGQTVWDVVGDGKTGASSPNSWGGHAVNVVGYDEAGVTIVTWGAAHKMTWAFWHAYVDEAYAILSQDWITTSGQAPSGFDVAALLADLQKVEAQEAPASITIGAETDALEQFEMTVPVFPWEISMKNATYWMQALPGGGMLLKFAPSEPGGGAFAPGVEVIFAADGWDQFKKLAAADGDESPIAAARSRIVRPGA